MAVQYCRFYTFYDAFNLKMKVDFGSERILVLRYRNRFFLIICQIYFILNKLLNPIRHIIYILLRTPNNLLMLTSVGNGLNQIYLQKLASIHLVIEVVCKSPRQ